MPKLVHALITAARLLRVAIIYLRQSSPGQVRDNTGSAAVQRNQEQLARDYGFTEIVVIDEDLGRSGRTVDGRFGLQEVCRQVAAGRVGAVFAINASRLSREMRGFSELIVLCRHHDTALVLDGRPRDPGNPQDVAMLHVEGTFAELDSGMRMQVLREARLAKVRLGQRVTRVPTGWILGPDGRPTFDPEVFDVIKSLPAVFWEHGSLRGAVRALIESGTTLPVRVRGVVHQRKPSVDRLLHFLLGAAFRGTYVFGRTESATDRPPLPNGLSARRRVPEDRWITIPGYYPAYMTEEEQERIRAHLGRNSFTRRHRPGPGQTLCQGLLVCARCHKRLTVIDPRPRRGSHRYQCTADSARFSQVPCMSLQGRDVDAAIERLVLPILEAPPLQMLQDALANARAAQRAHEARIESERARLAFEEKRALAQCESVDERNLRVAVHFQRRAEAAIAAREDFERRLAATPSRPPVDGSSDELRALCQMAADVPALWRNPLVTNVERKQILACLIDRVVIDATKEAIEATVHWVTGAETPIRVWRIPGVHRLILERHHEGMTVPEIRDWLARGDPITGQRWERTCAGIYGILRSAGLRPNPARRGRGVDQARVQELYDAGLTLEGIAAQLNEEGRVTSHGRAWTGNAVYHWLLRGGRREALEKLHWKALADAKRRGLTNQAAADEFNAGGLPRSGRGAWTAEVVRARRVYLNRRRRRQWGDVRLTA